MSAHKCKTLTPGCFRCELSRDEAEAFIEEDRADAQAAWIEYREWRLDEDVPHWREDGRAWIRRRTQRSIRKRDFIAGFMAGRRA